MYVIKDLKNELINFKNKLEDKNGFNIDELYVGRIWYRTETPSLFSVTHRMIFKKKVFKNYDVFELLDMNGSYRSTYINTPAVMYLVSVIDLVPLSSICLGSVVKPTREQLNDISKKLYEEDLNKSQMKKLVR